MSFIKTLFKSFRYLPYWIIKMISEKLYRPCVGIALFNSDGKLFVGERIDTPGAWQMPQGGIDEGEEAEHAFYREMKEEIGTDKATILDVMDRPVRYDFPDKLKKSLWNGKYSGQEQTWIAGRFTGCDTDIDINAFDPAEFSQWKWEKPELLLDLIVPFKKSLYIEVLKYFSGYNNSH